MCILVQNPPQRQTTMVKPLLKLLLGSQLVGVTALSLSAVGGSGGKSGVALTADRLLTVELGGKSLQRGFNHC